MTAPSISAAEMRAMAGPFAALPKMSLRSSDGVWQRVLLASVRELIFKQPQAESLIARGTKRVDNVYGDRNPVCTCAPLETYGEMAVLQAAE